MPQPTKAPLLYRESDETDWQPLSLWQTLFMVGLLSGATIISIAGIWHICHLLLRWVL